MKYHILIDKSALKGPFQREEVEKLMEKNVLRKTDLITSEDSSCWISMDEWQQGSQKLEAVSSSKASSLQNKIGELQSSSCFIACGIKRLMSFFK